MDKRVSLFALALASLPSASHAVDVSANVGITSNYVWRGITQSDDNLAVSAGIDAAHNSGLYAGVWASSVDFNDDTNAEIDLYTGYTFSSQNWDFDLGYIYYGYQGNSDLAFSEFYGKASYNNVAFGYSVLADSKGSADFGDSQYFEASYNHPLTAEINLELHAGYSEFDQGDNYQDYRVALSQDGLTIAYSKTTGNDAIDDNIFYISYQMDFDLQSNLKPFLLN